MFGWEVTVISSNFISLQLIITMAITIHLIVRYRELLYNNPGTEQRKLILDTVRFMMRPCLYAALTTIAGFGSLLLCDILPVITFGWMMCAGITVSLLLTFLLFPSCLMLLQKQTPRARRSSYFSLTSLFARFTEGHGVMILVISCITFIISAIGISRLVVENSFIDYFKHTTEIYQGMKVIDQNLGGTTPFDVIVDFEKTEASVPVAISESDTKDGNEFDEFDEFEEAESENKYWFTSDKMALVEQIHDYLDSLPETGKVLSLGTMMKIAERLNNGKPLDNFELAVLYSELPDNFRNVHLTGMLVLYNNMLQSLFSSQILTLGVVVLALMCMFLILFRSLKIALIAISPNLLSIGVVLGVMGWMNIPLDMMTITIAAISIGIAVDNTIHYIHRYRHEFKVDRNYIKAVHRCHGSIGYAMYYTSITIIIGFSILVLSNFIPSIYFGLLTGLAMLIALIAALTLLPQLIVFFKPFGQEAKETLKGI